MNLKSIIRVHNLGKRYHIVSPRAPYGTLRESITHFLSSSFRLLRERSNKDFFNALWALSNINFEVFPGEIVGIIGRNGAGKSTLLKILSRITQPTTGLAELHGRVACLLEVGTGFHGELSGRDNIYLNGAILGMNRSEIHRKFHDIVAFSEVESFIDTPVKHYSSGMYMRLAFSVAAHLEPDILIVDEVLAVGDSQFQKKCLGKIGDVARSGKAVLFVSHNMQAVTNLCTRALLLHSGKLVLDATATQSVQEYLRSGSLRRVECSWPLDSAPGNFLAKLMSVRVFNSNAQLSSDHDIAAPVSVELTVSVFKSSSRIDVSIHVINSEGICLFATGSSLSLSVRESVTHSGQYRTICTIPGNFLNDGKYFVSAFLVRDNFDIIASVPEAVEFTTHDYGLGRQGYLGRIIGVIRPSLSWVTDRIGESP